MTTPDLRSDSSPHTLLRALNDVTGELINVLDVKTLSSAALQKRNEVNRIRRLVSAHLRQVEGGSGPRDSGGRPQQP